MRRDEDNSKWLESLIEAQRYKPVNYGRIRKLLHQESRSIRILSTVTAVFLLIVLVYVLSISDLPVVSEMAGKVIVGVEMRTHRAMDLMQSAVAWLFDFFNTVFQ